MAHSQGTILLTGPNGGIGVGFVKQFLKSPHALTHEAIYAVRDPAKAMDLKAALKHAPKEHKHILLPVDFSSLASIRNFSADVNARIASGAIAPIRVLILNAGVQDSGSEHFTEDGFERTFAVNYLAIFLVTLLLLQSMDKKRGRIIYIGSTSASTTWWVNQSFYSNDAQKRDLITSPEKMAKGIEEHPDGDVAKTGHRRYSLSKMLLQAWMYELQRRLDADPSLSSISVLGHNPGWIGGTGINRNSPLTSKLVLKAVYYLAYVVAPFSANPLLRTARGNGDMLLTVCFDTEINGEFPKAKYINGTRLSKTVPEADREDMRRELWEKSLELAAVKEGETLLSDWK